MLFVLFDCTLHINDTSQMILYEVFVISGFQTPDIPDPGNQYLPNNYFIKIC